jgi:hypothetical protein
MISLPLPAFGASGVRKRLLFFLLALLAVGVRADGHPIHISLCELRLNPTTRHFEVSVKIFIDDLETTLRSDGFANMQIGTDREAANADEAISRYLRKHLRIEADGRTLDLAFHGKEVTEDLLAIWCYVEFTGLPASAVNCRITNDILQELYDDQKNIMDICMSATHKAYTILESGRPVWQYSF